MARKRLGWRAALALVNVLALFSLSSIVLLLIRFGASGNWRFAFLLWNLALAWVPLFLAAGLRLWLNGHRWTSWQALLLTALWLGFLPNSFYLVSDFVHLRSTGEVSYLFDVVLLQSFALNGLVLGFVSLYLVHGALRRRRSQLRSLVYVTLTLMLCSFAIYLGRYLRWNTWDAVLFPGNLAVDVINRLLMRPTGSGMLATTLLFSFFLTVTYLAVYRIVEILRSERV